LKIKTINNKGETNMDNLIRRKGVKT
jgi:hypothetical protein